MDGKKLKERLRSAREFLKNKQFEEALDTSKEILSSDANNYNALICQGFALTHLQRFGEALESYRKAGEADPSQVLAWQGICSVYEKQPDLLVNSSNLELIECYERLLDSIGADKSFEIGLKLCEACLNGNQFDRAVSVCERLISLDAWKDADDPSRFSVWKMLAVALPQSSKATDFELLETSCRSVINSTLSEAKDKALCWEHLLRCAVKRSCDADHIWKMCLDSSDFLEESVFRLELMCQIYLDTFSVEANSRDIGAAVEKLENLNPESCWLKLMKGHLHLLNAELTAAEPLLREGVKCASECVSGHLFAAQCFVGLHRVVDASQVITKALKLLRAEETCGYFGDRASAEELLNFCLAKAFLEYSDKNKWEDALNLLRQLCRSRPEQTNYKLCLGHALLKLEEFDEAEEVLNDLSKLPVSGDSLVLQGVLLFVRRKYDDAKLRFLEAVEMKSERPAVVHFYLGQIALRRLGSEDWSVEEREELQADCLKNLLQAAKLDPFCADVFVALGSFFQQILNDIRKARHCYEKAFELSGDNQEAGTGLVDCFLALEEQENALKILQTMTDASKPNSPKWAWMRLGLHQMKFGDPTEAIRSFQTAIKRDPKDHQCWECLGDAFVNRGSYNSAVKVFTKVTELAPDDLYSYHQIAALKLKMRTYAEAVDQYRWILERSPDYIPALQGLSEGCYQLSQDELNRLLYGRAVDHCQEALNHLTRAAKIRPELSCLWKQMGDACTILHVVPSAQLRISVPGVLLSSDSTEVNFTKELSKKELLALGARCYGMALKLRPEMSSLWHDLGVNYFTQTKVVEKVMSKSVAMKSLQALRKAVTLDPSCHQHWTALGVVAASKELSDPGLAQHCFIRSIEAESNNVVAWTNLGTLYLVNNHVKLAHEAFKVAQSLEPSYQYSWIGQAFIAETVADREAMDLFRHTTELASSLESCIGYGHWVCKTLQNPSSMSTKWYQYAIDHLNAVTAAVDAMSKYTDCVSDNLVAWNMYAILLERKNLIRPALCALEKAMKLLEATGDDKSKGSTTSAVCENYARLLCKNGKYEEAAKLYRTLGSEKSFDVACGLGLASLKAGQVDASILAYKEALDLSSNLTDRALVRVALGMAAFMTRDFNEAKTQFFQSLKDSPSTIDALKSLLGFAFLQRDPGLLMAVLQTLRKNVPATERPSDIVVLTAYVQLALRDVRGSMMELVKNIHLRPHLSDTWTQLSKFILLSRSDRHEIADHCSRVSAIAGDANHKLDALLCFALASMPRLSSVNHEAFRIAQKAVHLRPDVLSSWSLLLSVAHLKNVTCVLEQKPNSELLSFACALAERILSQIEAELRVGQTNKTNLQLLRKWSSRQFALSLFLSNRLESAAKFLEQAAWFYDDDPVICGLSSIFAKDGSLGNLMKDKPSSHLYQIQLSQLMCSGPLPKARNCYRLWLKEFRLSGVSPMSQAMRSFVSKSLFQMHVQNGSEKELQELLALAKECKDEDVLQLFEGRQNSGST